MLEGEGSVKTAASPEFHARSMKLRTAATFFALPTKLALGDQAALQRPLDERHALLVLRQVLDPELLEQGAQVGLDRVDAEVELVGDLPLVAGVANEGPSLNGRQSSTSTRRWPGRRRRRSARRRRSRSGAVPAGAR